MISSTVSPSVRRATDTCSRWPLLFDPLDEALRAHVHMEHVRQIRVVPAALGQTAGLIGAAALVFAGDHYWNAD
jgi:glucokinase